MERGEGGGGGRRFLPNHLAFALSCLVPVRAPKERAQNADALIDFPEELCICAGGGEQLTCFYGRLGLVFCISCAGLPQATVAVHSKVEVHLP